MKKEHRFLKKVIVTLGIVALIFTICMIWIFVKFQSVPSELIVSFFALIGLEGGCCAFIKKIDDDEAVKPKTRQVRKSNLKIKEVE